MSSSIMKMISFIDGLLRLALFLGTTILLLMFIWQAKKAHHYDTMLDDKSSNLNILYSFPPIAICLLGLLGAFYKNPFWLKLYALAMVIMALGYTIFIMCYDKVILTTSVSGFILFHYILAYLAHYLSRTIEEQKSHQALMRSYIQYQDELLLPSYPQLSSSASSRNNANNNQHHLAQNPYYVNPALEPPPSYNSLNGFHH